MGVNSLPKTVTRQRRGCDLNPGPSAPESSTLTTRLPSRLDLALNPPLVLAISQSVTRTDGKVPFAGDAGRRSSSLEIQLDVVAISADNLLSLFPRNAAPLPSCGRTVSYRALGQLSLASPLGRLIEYLLRLG